MGVSPEPVLGPPSPSLLSYSSSHGFNGLFGDDCQIDRTSPFLLKFQSHTNCLLDVSNWMSRRHLKLNLSEAELITFPLKPPLLLTSLLNSKAHCLTCSQSQLSWALHSLTPQTLSTAKGRHFHLHSLSHMSLFSLHPATTLLQDFITSCTVIATTS